VLLELFPDAHFVHIVRDPSVVYPSTINLWKSMYETHGFQKPRLEGLEERIVKTYAMLYGSLDRGKSLVPPGHWCELRYEDLIRDPVGEMRKVYEGLALGDFESVQPRIEGYFDEQKDYQVNRYPPLTGEQRRTIATHSAAVIERYGYEPDLTLAR
jgi:hypothetical protein